MFSEIVMNLLELIETRIIKTREYTLSLLNKVPSFLNEVLSIKPLRDPLSLVAVDSGFAEIHYLGFRFFIINVAIMVVENGKSKVNTYFGTTNAGQDDVEKQALNLELKLGINVMRKHHVNLLMLDGPISMRDRSIINGESVLAHVKDVESNRYTQSVADERFRMFLREYVEFVGEPLIMYLLMETYRRSHNDYDNVLVSKPFVIDEVRPSVMGFYVQYIPNTIPMYVEFVGSEDPLELVARVAPMAMAPRLGYPAPLYVVDRVSRVNESLKSMVKLVLEKLGGDAIRELRSVYFSRDINDYVKDIK